ncbi:Aldo/keto reductase [Mycena galopus ATCC 62051]|nr:Aldo/keto reductase [Mycena galopus ATCC 62051]
MAIGSRNGTSRARFEAGGFRGLASSINDGFGTPLANTSFWAPPAPPSTKLAVYRQLAPLAGIHGSPLQLGSMSIGDLWGDAGMGEMDKASSFKLLDAYYEAGGNFIDTANNYQDESSEKFIGEWAEERGICDQLVIATKYTAHQKRRDTSIKQKVHYIGKSLKAMHISVEASLKKLRTNHINIFYLHWWDWETGVEEVMNGLHNLVTQGKFLHLGISDTPAWVVAQVKQYARDHRKTPFVIYQGKWNLFNRSFEPTLFRWRARTVCSICFQSGLISNLTDLGLALAPWNVIAHRITGEKGRTMFSPKWERDETERKMSYALEKVAGEVGVKNPKFGAVAIAYVLTKVPFCVPIIGGRKVEHFEANI